MRAHPKAIIPAWLETPPVISVNPPVLTREQELPFGELTWEDFEKLCLRLARLEGDVEHCQLYGERGQNQQGIDIYTRLKRSTAYRVYQCKREKSFGPAKIQKAVSLFLDGEWAGKADTLVLCTTESLVSTDRSEALESQQELLRAKGITLLAWDSHQLSARLKDLPEVVDDFFGREWVAVFCGDDVAKRLGGRLDARGVAEFRQKFAAFYRRVFNKHDPGLPLASVPLTATALSLEERYVMPDIDDRRSLVVPQAGRSQAQSEIKEIRFPSDDAGGGLIAGSRMGRARRNAYPAPHRTIYKHRQEVESWLAAAERNIILGGPGSGKSTLLRFLTIDLLQESPYLGSLAQKWGRHLPVWIPFALWTRMIASSPTGPSSLKDLLHNWLRSWDEEGLWPLIERALEDKRLLLLVDGLDEWTNEQAAIIALERLLVFIEQRELPAVVTSRPHGFGRLGMRAEGWQVGTLSDFSAEQQQELSRIWFSYRARVTDDGSTGEADRLERMAESDMEEFIAELRASPDLQELAKVPLLLTLLIAHRYFNARLPHSRFKAYDSLIEHLLTVHPQRRMTAASVTQSSIELAGDDVKRVLSYLAYRVHECFGEGIIGQGEAVAIVEEFLRGGEGGFFDFAPYEARKYSREVLEAGEITTGLLVERSPKEIGFYHRAFQEYLAGLYIAAMPFAQQLLLVGERCVDPQWREVILALFYSTSRQEDIKQFIERIKAKEVIGAERYTVEALLSEVAFGDFNCSVGVARELGREALKSIELGDWMPHREQLLGHALEGLRSAKIKEMVKAKLKEWFPQRSWWRQGMLFDAMAKWPRLPGVIDCLVRGMHDEDAGNQRHAAAALADLASGDEIIGVRMDRLASSSLDPTVRAAALEGLLRGWPQHTRLPEIVEAARTSLNPELRLAGIIGRIQLHRHTEEDQKELFYLGTYLANLDYKWRDEIAKALILGWPKSPDSKEACFKRLRARRREDSDFDQKLAGRILLEGFPQDEEVAGYCVQEIEKLTSDEVSLFLSSSHENWQLLAQHFRGHPLLVEAIDKWLPAAQAYRIVDIMQAALVGRTDAAKARVLTYLSQAYSQHWAAKTLLYAAHTKIPTPCLAFRYIERQPEATMESESWCSLHIEGWGMCDEEVATILRTFAFGPSVDASRIADLLPRIIEDEEECRNRLLGLLRNAEDNASVSRVLEGLEILGKFDEGSETASLIVGYALRQPRGEYGYSFGLHSFLRMFRADPRVTKLAKLEASRPDGDHPAVASVYGEDEEIRELLIGVACPLPEHLRTLIAAYLGEGAGDEDFALQLLELYDYDHGSAVLTQGSISYHARLKSSGRDVGPALEKLSRDIVGAGPNYEERRQAALAGLLTLGRPDVMALAEEPSAPITDRRCRVPVVGRLAPNLPLLKLILRNWTQIKEALGDGIWTQLAGWSDAGTMELWEEFCLLADEYPVARDEALAFLETKRTARANILSFISRVRPKSQLLLENCLYALAGPWPRSIYHLEQAAVAAELLGKYFGRDQEVLERLLAARHSSTVDKDGFDEGLTLALCEGWPESAALADLFKAAKEQNAALSSVTYFQLLCRNSRAEVVFDNLLDALEDFERNSYIWDVPVVRPIARRLQGDDDFLSLMLAHIERDPTPTEKATIAKLVAAARGVSPQLRSWCVDEVEQQMADGVFPEVGFDLVSGRSRPVVHSLLEVLRLD